MARGGSSLLAALRLQLSALRGSSGVSCAAPQHPWSAAASGAAFSSTVGAGGPALSLRIGTSAAGPAAAAQPALRLARMLWGVGTRGTAAARQHSSSSSSSSSSWGAAAATQLRSGAARAPAACRQGALLPGRHGPRAAGLLGGGRRPLAAAVASGCGGGAGGAGGSCTTVRTLWQDRSGYQHFDGRGRAWVFSGRRAMYITAGAAGAVLSYYLYCIEEVPYTGRRHSIMLVSEANERWMGQVLFNEQKALALAEGRLLPEAHPYVRRVRRLGAAIAAVAGDGAGGGHFTHMRNLDWDFAVIDDPQPNAFVVPGGKVVVFTGLLRLLAGPDSDAELAAVLAHEVGHVLARHSAERMSTLNAWALLNMALRLTLGFGLPGVAMYMGIFLPYSRLAETEADRIGLRLMARACFDPAAAPAMLAKLNAVEKQMQGRGATSKIPAFLRTHPLTEARVALVETELRDAYRLYAEAGCAAKRSAFSRGLGAFDGALAPGWPGEGGEGTFRLG